MRNKKSMILILVILILVITGFFSVSFAISSSNFNFTAFDGEGNTKVNAATEKTMGTAVSVIRIVATGISIIMLSYIGIKYMMAAPQEKADFKKSISIYVLGAILIFASGNILLIIEKYIKTL